MRILNHFALLLAAAIQASAVLMLFTDVALCEDADAGQAVRTGEFQLIFTLAEVAGADSALAVETIIAPDEPITWEVYVPESYKPENPTGLMVYISPSRSGDIPRRWKSVMDKRNIVWIAANHSGNRVKVARRAIYAIVAPTLAGNHYKIDPERIYVSGFSGGSRIAGMVAADYPQLFKGAIFNCGIDFWGNDPPRQFELVKKNHYVFVTGTRDHALEQTKRVHKQYLSFGVENSLLMVIRGMTHKNPGTGKFDEAIVYLDSRFAQNSQRQGLR